MRGVISSAYVVTVKPAGTVGMTPSGFGMVRLCFGLPVPGAGSASARGCGTTEVCCANTSAPADAMVTSDVKKTARFIATPSTDDARPARSAKREGGQAQILPFPPPAVISASICRVGGN